MVLSVTESSRINSRRIIQSVAIVPILLFGFIDEFLDLGSIQQCSPATSA
jgi:hypothetical protein